MHVLSILAGMVIGCVSFTGSMIAYGKLSGKIKDHTFPGQHIFNLVVLLVIVVIGAYIIHGNGTAPVFIFYSILGLSVCYGILFVLPIGGADMPVVISLLNSFTGIATACAGFLYNNQVMLNRRYPGGFRGGHPYHPDVQGDEPLFKKCADRLIWWTTASAGMLQANRGLTKRSA